MAIINLSDPKMWSLEHVLAAGPRGGHNDIVRTAIMDETVRRVESGNHTRAMRQLRLTKSADKTLHTGGNVSHGQRGRDSLRLDTL